MARKEMRLDDVQKMLRKACDAAGSLSKFAEANGLQKQYVSQVLSGGRPPSERLCDVLGIAPDGMRWVRK